MAVVYFQEPEVVISRSWIEIFCRNLVRRTPIALGLLECKTWPNQKPEVDLVRFGRPLVISI